MISENTVSKVFGSVGCKNGTRHTTSTLLREHEWSKNFVEAQFVHKEAGVSGAYNKVAYLRQRRKMMQCMRTLWKLWSRDCRPINASVLLSWLVLDEWRRRSSRQQELIGTLLHPICCHKYSVDACDQGNIIVHQIGDFFIQGGRYEVQQRA